MSAYSVVFASWHLQHENGRVTLGRVLPTFPVEPVYLEDGDSFERVEVDVHGNLGLEFLRQFIEDTLLVQGLTTVPLVVKPGSDECSTGSRTWV